jgi:acyl-CoA reductase-like NAD-dependent aldehyde dehydrogenase
MSGPAVHCVRSGGWAVPQLGLSSALISQRSTEARVPGVSAGSIASRGGLTAPSEAGEHEHPFPIELSVFAVNDEPPMPFGGVKHSGWGRFGGRAALEEFPELRWITVQDSPRKYLI